MQRELREGGKLLYSLYVDEDDLRASEQMIIANALRQAADDLEKGASRND